MGTLEQKVRTTCAQLDCTFTEYEDSHFIVETGDERVFVSNSHSITAHIDSWSTNKSKMRNDALRFILQELDAGVFAPEGQCDDGDDCDTCGAR